MPDFVGDRFIDHMNAVYLNKEIIKLCTTQLREGGTLLMKIIQGPAEEKLYKYATDGFEKVQRVKPNASRTESKEIYFLCTNYGASLNEMARQLKDTYDKLRNKDEWEKNPVEAEKIFNEVSDTQRKIIQQNIDERHRRGEDSKCN